MPAPSVLPSRPSRRGVGSTEYIWVTVSVAIALLLVVTIFGRKISDLAKSATTSLDQGTPVGSKPFGELSSLDGTAPDPAKDPGGTTTTGPTTTPTAPTTPDPAKPVDPMSLSPEERAGRSYFIETPKGAEVYIFDPKGNKVAKATVGRVEAKDVGYQAAAFAGKGTLNFCNGTTYTADLTVLGAKGEARGPGVNFGGSEKERDLRDDKGWQDGKPSLGVDLFKIGGEVVGIKIEGTAIINDDKPLGLVDAFIISTAPPGMEPTPQQIEQGRQFIRENVTEFLLEVAGGPEKAREIMLSALDEADRNIPEPSRYRDYPAYLAKKAALKSAKLALHAAGLGTGAFELAMEGGVAALNGVMDVSDFLNRLDVKVERKVFVTAGKLSGDIGVGFSTDFAGAKAGASAMAVEAGASTKVTITDIDIFGKNPSVSVDVSGGFGIGIEGKAGYEKGKGFGVKLGATLGWGGSVGVSVGLEDAK